MLNYSGNSFFIVYIFLINCLRIIFMSFFVLFFFNTCSYCDGGHSWWWVRWTAVHYNPVYTCLYMHGAHFHIN